MEHHDFTQEKIPPILRPLSPEDLADREEMESDPENYKTEVYLPGIEEDAADLTKKFRDLQSGYVDFRNTAEDPQGKNVVWIGDNHAHIMHNGAKFPDDVNLSNYIIGLKTNYDRERRQFKILRDVIGQSCTRSPEHLAKVIDAAEQALNRDLIQNDREIQRQFAMEDYGLSTTSNKHIYMEGVQNEELPAYDAVLLSPETEMTFSDPALMKNLQEKIQEHLHKLTKDPSASIRIPYKLSSTTKDREEIFKLEAVADEFGSKFESENPTITCHNSVTRRAHADSELPNVSWGYLTIINEAE